MALNGAVSGLCVLLTRRGDGHRTGSREKASVCLSVSSLSNLTLDLAVSIGVTEVSNANSVSLKVICTLSLAFWGASLWNCNGLNAAPGGPVVAPPSPGAITTHPVEWAECRPARHNDYCHQWLDATALCPFTTTLTRSSASITPTPSSLAGTLDINVPGNPLQRERIRVIGSGHHRRCHR